MAALARKEALSEREKELYFINQVCLSLCHHVSARTGPNLAPLRVHSTHYEHRSDQRRVRGARGRTDHTSEVRVHHQVAHLGAAYHALCRHFGRVGGSSEFSCHINELVKFERSFDVHFGYIEHDVYLKIIYGSIIFISGELTHCSHSKFQHPINDN